MHTFLVLTWNAEFKVVLANGTFVTANEVENPNRKIIMTIMHCSS